MINGTAIIHVGRVFSTIEGTVPATDIDKAFTYSDARMAKLVNREFIGWNPNAGRIGEIDVGRDPSSMMAAKAKNKQMLERTKNMVHLFDIIDNKFPSGLVDDVCDILEDHDIEYDIVEDCEPPQKKYPRMQLVPTYKGEPLILRDYQKLAMDQSQSNRLGLFALATNAGKSLLTCAMIADKGVKTLILVQKKEMADQWAHEFIEKYLGIKCGVWYGGRKPKLKPVTVAIVNTVANQLELAKEYGFEMVIVDEAHHAASTTHHTVVREINPYYCYGLTGTAFRTNKQEEVVLRASFGKTLMEIDNRYMQDHGYSLPVRIDIRKCEQKARKGVNWNELYRECISDSSERNGLIADVVSEFYDKGHSILVLANEVTQCDALATIVAQKTGVEPGIGHSGLTDVTRRQALRDFRTGASRILIGTLYREGIDIDHISVVINAGALKSMIQTFQGLGRGLRTGEGVEECIYVDFLDEGDHYLYKHALERMKNLEEAGCELPDFVQDIFKEEERRRTERSKMTDEDKERIALERAAILEGRKTREATVENPEKEFE